MIGYYIHHHGSGHLHRATAINAAMGHSLTGLSTHPRPTDWRGDWVELADDVGGSPEQDLTAGGALHYAPERHTGLRTRMAQISAWIERAQPDALVVDVSVEVALLARLHGVPVVKMAMPGLRTDRSHQLGYDLARVIMAPWPAAARSIWPGATSAQLSKTKFVGAISRYQTAARVDRVPRRIVVLNGTGGGGPTASAVAAARAATPGWEWVHLDRDRGTWVDDPWPLICSAGVMVSHTGQNAVAEIAAAQRPAVLIPQPRPFDEQLTTATALRNLGWAPALVRDYWPEASAWSRLLQEAEQLDGSGWSRWNDGRGAERAAEVLAGVTHPTVETVPA